MFFYSLKDKSIKASFREAAITGQAPDGGLYYPSETNILDGEFWRNIKQVDNEEIAFQIIKPYIGGEIPDVDLRRIAAETVAFDIPLKKISHNISTLELFHGPTLAFKDVGARFMSRCLGYFSQNKDSKEVTVLVATSGDTGGAVAAGFHGVAGVRVVILYPKGKVSALQELQLTTWGDNISAVAMEGNFDDCQAIVKKAFLDNELNERFKLTSANSINVARWLPQQFYYAFLWKQWEDKDNPPVICVPSGNFGNICAGMLLAKSGMPVQKFIAATNANDTIPTFYQTGDMPDKKAVATMSNAMDVALPSNFVRIMEMFMTRDELIRYSESVSITEAETADAMKELYGDFQYLADPHGAVGFAALKRYLDNNGGKGVFLETAHPCKFDAAITHVLGITPTIPAGHDDLSQKASIYTTMQADFDTFKAWMMG